MTLVRIFRAGLLGALVAACLPVVAEAQEKQRRELLADRILQGPENRAETDAFERELTDSIARTVFKQLRPDAAWTADHALWQRHFAGFRAAYERIARQFPDAEGEQRLKAALVEQMTESELEQVVEVLGNAEFSEARAVARQLGFDAASMVRMLGIIGSPALYSSAEKESLKKSLAGLKEREAEFKPLLQRMEGAMRMFRSPAFLKYQQVLSAVVMQSLARFRPGSAGMEIREFADEWRARVAQ